MSTSAPTVRYAFVKKNENAPKGENAYELFIGLNAAVPLSGGELGSAGFFPSEQEALKHAENMGCEVRKPGQTNPISEEKKDKKDDVKDSK